MPVVLLWGALVCPRAGAEPPLLQVEHKAEVLCAAWSPDGKTLATGCQDGTIRLTDVTTAKEIHTQLKRLMVSQYDEVANIGQRYRRQDEIGTPFCVTVDFDTLEDQAVTIRERDAMTQDRVALDGVSDYLAARLKGC